ncbi:hypothetical protein BJ684DRAFT_9401 [Piptocephalis cylindrospora]|uniref:oligopeptidase A n=1 Tax=Piptocephalis cylindrospora TaxID=1907219 RepID=A0A4P9Y7K6_9FUNG|nr:hypothetical protein BJ684DRAFT_9401 [Piptocephalis cylindrospora]|eukprot:RKP13900.1 hypothetical protein BJ684DRAFT_9401 [Piptocephalis cylindrospora]
MATVTSSSPGHQAETGPLRSLSLFPDFEGLNEDRILPDLESLVKEVEQEFTQLEPTLTPTWQGSLGALESLEMRLEYAFGIVQHLSGVRDTAKVREALRVIQPKLIRLGLRMGRSPQLYQVLRQQLDSEAAGSLTGTQRRIMRNRLVEMQISGVDLAEGSEQAKRFAEVKGQLGELSLTFSNNLLDAIKAYVHIVRDPTDLAGCPESLRETLAGNARSHGHPEATSKAGPWAITLEQPILVPFMETCMNQALREQVYRANVTKAPENAKLIPKILALRHEMATLVGYPNYAVLSRQTKMAKTGPKALLDQLYASVHKEAKGELSRLEAFATEHLSLPTPLRPWDTALAREALRKRETRYSEEEISKYFSFDRVILGMFDLTRELFGVEVSQVPSSRYAELGVSLWHPDVRLYEVREAGQVVAYFYGDFYSRPENKRSGAWMDVCSTRRRDTQGNLRLPISYLICNQSRPNADTGVSLMKFSDVLTLFHEFGHCLQHILTRVDHPQAAGVNGIEWDFVEVASQLMENFCYEPSTLQRLSGHHETGDPMPLDMIKALQKERQFLAGMDTLRQLQFSNVDLALHAKAPLDDQEPFAVDKEVSQKFSLIERIPEDRFLCSFSHIFAGGYSAGYYSYKWSEVYASDGYAAFEEADSDQGEGRREVGQRYRDTVLSLGGGTDPHEVWKAFRGRSDASVNHLLRHQGLQGQ